MDELSTLIGLIGVEDRRLAAIAAAKNPFKELHGIRQNIDEYRRRAEMALADEKTPNPERLESLRRGALESINRVDRRSEVRFVDRQGHDTEFYVMLDRFARAVLGREFISDELHRSVARGGRIRYSEPDTVLAVKYDICIGLERIGAMLASVNKTGLPVRYTDENGRQRFIDSPILNLVGFNEGSEPSEIAPQLIELASNRLLSDFYTERPRRNVYSFLPVTDLACYTPAQGEALGYFERAGFRSTGRGTFRNLPDHSFLKDFAGVVILRKSLALG